MLALRALIVYPLTILLFRLIGRGLQFQSRPYDFAVQVLLGSAAANLIVDSNISVWRAFSALGTLALLHTAISFLSLWNPLKKYLVGEPTIVVETGRILRANLIKHQISVEEVISALREKGYHNLADVEYAQLEASGKLSVIPRAGARNATPEDLGLRPPPAGFSTILVADGRVDRQNLGKLGRSEQWLTAQLTAHGAGGPQDVLFASADPQGQLFVVRNQDVPFLRAIFKGIQVQTSPGVPPLVGQQLPPPGPVPPAPPGPGDA